MNKPEKKVVDHVLLSRVIKASSHKSIDNGASSSFKRKGQEDRILMSKKLQASFNSERKRESQAISGRNGTTSKGRRETYRASTFPLDPKISADSKSICEAMSGRAHSKGSAVCIMMQEDESSLKLQKRLADSVMRCGKKKVWLDPNEINEIANTNSRQNIRKLIKDGLIIKKPVVVHSRYLTSFP
uniref:Large ribosomal subunit protein eL19 n=1 Tax=Glossina pallidipes TaxID=7398 RepID=A0A1B0A1S0_GLOPL